MLNKTMVRVIPGRAHHAGQALERYLDLQARGQTSHP